MRDVLCKCTYHTHSTCLILGSQTANIGFYGFRGFWFQVLSFRFWVFGFLGVWVSGFKVLGFKVSGFFGFWVLGFLGFRVLWFPGFRVLWFLGFLVSGF